MNNYTTALADPEAGSRDVPDLSGAHTPLIPGITPSGDTRCPAWCDPAWCSPEIVHRTASIEVDLGEATADVSLRQWRNGYPDELLDGWQSPRITVYVQHKTEMIDFGFEDCQPVIVRASEPMALGVCFAAPPGAVRRFIAVQEQLLGLLTEDGGVGHE